MRRWLLIIGVVAGATAVILYFTSPGLFAPPEDRGPIAVAVPPPTEEAPTKTPKLTPTPESGPAPTPAPLLLSYTGWILDCPDCPVVVLDTKEPEVIGAASLQPGDLIRLVGCTRAQTTVPHQYVFEAASGHYSGVALFDTGERPGSLYGLECFEMLGEYRGTDTYAVSIQYVDGQWEYELAQGEPPPRADGSEWEPAGVLPEFGVGDWARLSPDEYATVLAVRSDPVLAAMLSASPPTARAELTLTPAPTLLPTATAWPTTTPSPTPAPVPTNTPRPNPSARPRPDSHKRPARDGAGRD